MIVSDQPVALPTSAAASSMMYSDQVPFGGPPLKVARLTLPLGTGAGAENGSPNS